MAFKESYGKTTKRPSKPRSSASEGFYSSLVEKGKPDWKKAPKELKIKAFGVYGMLLAIPVFVVSLYEIYRRLEGKSTKKIQEGEILDDRLVRWYDKDEKRAKEENSIMFRLFGRDFFQEGTTSKTMNRGRDREIQKSEDVNERKYTDR